MIDRHQITRPLGETIDYSPDIEALLNVRETYAQIRGRGVLHALWARLFGRPHRLKELHDAAPGAYPVAGHSIQRAQVPIDRIVGSESRGHDFDHHFTPIQIHTRERWISVAIAWYTAQPLPPVRLIALGNDYYVRDGHHRISVARAFGADSIDAEVEQWQPATIAVACPLTPASLPC